MMNKQNDKSSLNNRRSVDDILTEYIDSHPFGNGSEVLASVLKSRGIMDLDNGNWDDEYDILRYLPPCPVCRSKMRYCYNADLLQCPDCGYVIFGIDYPYHEMPFPDEITENDYKSKDINNT